ncbi:MAG: phage major capsid protein [Peptostreptococcaceae bacterium]
MKKSQELLNRLNALQDEAKALVSEGKGSEALAKTQEVKEAKAAYEAQLQIEEFENGAPIEGNPVPQEPIVNQKVNGAATIRAMIKAATGKKLTEAENALLLPSTGSPNGENGEGYLLPQDIRTRIVKKVRQMNSMRDVLGYMPTTELSGSFPVENFETVTELVDFTDGTDGQEADDIEWINISFKLKEKGALIKLSNTLLKMTDENLIEYVANIFARKAVVTENKLAIAALKLNKTIKPLAGWDSLRKSFNVDLDPGVLYDCAILTNQSGFEGLDGAKDSNGNPILEKDVQVPTRKTFKGHPIIVFSDANMPNRIDGAKKLAPMIYGNLKLGVSFVDNEEFAIAFSSEAGFKQNATYGRIIEFVDVVQVDKSDKCYIVGEMDVTTP